MRTLIIRPNCNQHVDIIMPPLGPAYLASYLRENHNVQVRIIDMAIADYGYEGLENQIRAFSPDVLAISALNFESKGAHRIAAISKSIDEGLKVVIGGPYPTAYVKTVMSDRNIDFAVLGEGEETFAKLLQTIRRGKGIAGISGIAFRENGGLQITPPCHLIDDLDSLPFPAWDLVDLAKYPERYDRMSRTGLGVYVPLFTSRGCPYQCIYCHRVFGKHYRFRSPKSVVDEIETMIQQCGIREYEIVDDCFNYHMKRAKEIFRGIIERKLDVRITFPAAVRGDKLDEEFIVLAKKAGVIFMAVAIESGSMRIQKMLKKNLDLNKVQNNIALLCKHGIFVQGFFMIGFPGETRSELLQTIRYACLSKLNAVNLLIVCAFEGSELADLVRKAGKPVYSNFDQNYMSKGFSNLTDLPDWELSLARHVGLARFWLHPKRIVSFVRAYPYKSRIPYLSKVYARRLLLRV